MSVRVRYAPSPTGLQHIGGIRTALFNYFFARSQGGKFILRVEDTDQERFDERALQDIYDTFEWLGISWDEGPDTENAYGPYFQSKRKDLYLQHAKELIEKDQAYYCFCSSERLDEIREAGSHGYDRHCRNLTKEEAQAKVDAGESHVIRFKVPLEGETRFKDVVLGKVKRKNEDINPDPVLIKTDGFPTYHLANVVDDHLMEITHILRAQEWVPSGALHVLLYQAFGWEPPTYCHLPMVMGKDGQKLSKRHGSTSVIEFRNSGYLPEAVLNYVSLLGWSLDDKTEFFSKDELEKVFSIERINKAPGVFDYKKLDWFNGQYMRQLSDTDLKVRILPYMQKAGLVSNPLTSQEEAILDGAVPHAKERLKLLSDAPEAIGFLFKEDLEYSLDLLVPKGLDHDQLIAVLEKHKSLIEDFAKHSEEENEERFKSVAEELGLKVGQVLMPLRVAVTGTKASPPLMASIELVGVELSKKRIDIAIELLKTNKETT